MPLITYVENDGARYEVDVASGTSVMQGALDNAITGIVAECGGGLSCATCHCYVDGEWIARAGEAGDTERQMLEFVAADKQAGSRLSCQIVVNENLAGLIVHLPAAQV